MLSSVKLLLPGFSMFSRCHCNQ